MAEAKKKKILDLPIKLFFNDEGINYFIKNNKKLQKFKLADDVERYGIYFQQFSPASIQKLILINYVSNLEISRPEFMSKRQDVMDLSKLITYATLYRRFDEVIFTKTIESDLIKQWNRQNPGNIIDRKTTIKDTTLLESLAKSKGTVDAIKQEMLKPIYDKVKDNDDFLPEEKNSYLFLAEKYLNTLRPFTWFILSRFKDSNEYLDLLNQIEITLQDFMEKSKISEYLSLMVMELAIYAENSNMQSFAAERYKGTLNPMDVMYDPEMRKMIIVEMEKRNQNVFLAWKIAGDSKGVSSRSKLTVQIYNKEAGFVETKKTVDDTKGVKKMKEKTLMDFYKEEETNTEQIGDNSMGLYYLSFLSEECAKVGVHFESLVHEIQESKLTVITLNMLF
jgi:hypothetical protein